MSKEQKPNGMRNAVIGLIGTMLTVCGGLTGALVTNAAAIYQLEVENRKVAMKATGGAETLKVNAGEIFITRQDAATLDPADYYVDLEQGFVLHRPLDGWDDLEEMTVEEQLAESGVTCTAICDQPVYRLRHGEPIQIESDRNSIVNGKPFPENLLSASEQLYGPPPWSVPYYNMLVLNIYGKDQVNDLGITSLADMLLLMTTYSAGRAYEMIVPDGENFAVVQLSSTYDSIRVDGQPDRLTIDDWMFFAETDDLYYMLEIRYTAGSGGSIQVWDDLQYYMDQFRVIRKGEQK
jgi:hypothetical protein